METKDKETVLKQLQEQYRIYRAEVRSYNQIAGASTSVLVLLLFGTMAAAKENPTILFLIPLAVISYSAVIANIATFGHMAGWYSALLERKMNKLLDAPVFQYESNYVGPKRSKDPSWKTVSFSSEPFEFFIFTTVFPAVLPLALSVYAFYKLFDSHRTTALILIVALPVSLLTFIVCTARIFQRRRTMNEELIAEWDKLINGTASQ